VVAELHHGADADLFNLGHIAPFEVSRELAQVGNVELGRAGARARVFGKMDFPKTTPSAENRKLIADS
jgi:hypothetical protein